LTNRRFRATFEASMVITGFSDRAISCSPRVRAAHESLVVVEKP
jgi:hypothetical protein